MSVPFRLNLAANYDVPGCRFLLQLNKEQKLANECDTKTPFDGQRDILRRLAVFHVFQTRDDDAEQVEKGDTDVDDLFINWLKTVISSHTTLRYSVDVVFLEHLSRFGQTK